METETETFMPAIGDVIVLSNGRQALNAIAFIEEFRGKLDLQPFVLGLYTNANLKEKNRIANLLADNNVQFQMLQLPIGAAYFSLRRQSRILRTYRLAFSAIKPKRLFLFNYNTHYGFAYDLARKASVPIFFIEEGLSSYKINDRYAPPRALIQIIDRDVIGDSFLGKVLLEAPYRIVTRPRKVAADLLKFLRKELAFFSRCISMIDNELVASRLKALFRWSYRYKRFHTPVYAFDGVYGTFPERLAERFVANEKSYYSYIKKTFEATQSEFAARLADYGITQRSVLYVDQAYDVDKNIIFGVIAEWILREFPDTDTLYIKPHPKSGFSLDKLELQWQADKGLEIKLLSDGDVPAEFIPALSECRKVVGIASTTLAYARDLCPDVETYSIYRQLLPLIRDDARTVELLKEHGSILEGFPGVRFV
ncbi:alpha-2,8-polysialyltransferase family protein [Ensifer sp. LCM 4579]|uniref:alpha-2,8-polysialyltransferase family protein n=1 Tax=Ensifer sp. LCM 4579 TaxID=1848292 RepID=UPI001FCD7A81|nr:alpha-2,8-polysialyltransferase family protein [Ensifer sp. LCM 4579]